VNYAYAVIDRPLSNSSVIRPNWVIASLFAQSMKRFMSCTQSCLHDEDTVGDSASFVLVVADRPRRSRLSSCSMAMGPSARSINGPASKV